MYYVDRDGDGWRDIARRQPPWSWNMPLPPSAADRELNEVWKKSMTAVGIQIVFKTAKWPREPEVRTRRQAHDVGSGQFCVFTRWRQLLDFGYGPQKFEGNLAAFLNDEFDRLYRQQVILPDGPERLAIIQKMVKILIAYMPYKFNTHRIRTDVMQPWLIGYRRHPTSRLILALCGHRY